MVSVTVGFGGSWSDGSCWTTRFRVVLDVIEILETLDSVENGSSGQTEQFDMKQQEHPFSKKLIIEVRWTLDDGVQGKMDRMT